MNAVDASTHYDPTPQDSIPLILAVVIDTNPRAWASLAANAGLPLSAAVANVLLFVNTHLTMNNTNRVAVVAAHLGRSVWLYPRRGEHRQNGEEEEEEGRSANKTAEFVTVEKDVADTLVALMGATSAEDLRHTTPMLSGALSLALTHINKQLLAHSTPGTQPSTTTHPPQPTTTTQNPSSKPSKNRALSSRILILSVSDSSPTQYIPTMNTVFASARSQSPPKSTSSPSSAPPPSSSKQATSPAAHSSPQRPIRKPSSHTSSTGSRATTTRRGVLCPQATRASTSAPRVFVTAMSWLMGSCVVFV